ncbi:Na+/H+ antiporter NhaC [Paenibacillus sp.]|jgi:NhaC family Na+:H+ antiporter|uniref:Na+/H+ antiporter NhaC n=1 Tax=Paenibacillus sp. TaxID=58172 RepID=UPI00282E513B|nr:Na+/H+ antiporter NhaC [Paenibacillus sp.]MDR0270215.1 Na+/H+ antiporter NhaC [Paenibacillus sp.]
MDKEVTLKESLFLLVVLLAIIGASIIGLGMDPQIPILVSLGIIIIFGKIKKVSWDRIHKGIMEGISPGLVPILIFMLIGALISVWIAAGTIQTIMVYGFNILSAKYFLPSVFVICTVVGITVGSSFTTISTVGIAFFGMGQIMGYHPAIVTGAIVSGAFLGNNISPLSDTTNLASAIAEVDLFDHIKYMIRVVIPAFLISLIFFGVMGHAKTLSTGQEVNQLVDTLSSSFPITVVTLIPVLVLFLSAWRKIPAIPTLLVSIVFTIGVIYIYHPHTSLTDISALMQNGYVSNTGVETVDKLLTRGGIQSMMWSVSLILLALALGGLLVELNIIKTIISRITSFVSTKGKLILMTALSSMGINLLLGEQYLSIILPGEAFKSQYDAINIERREMSRIVANAGAAVNALIPWGVSGVFITGTLGVSTLEYLPFTIFCIAAPILNILYGFMGRGPKASSNTKAA